MPVHGRDRWVNYLLSLLVVCAVVMTVAVARREFFPASNPSPQRSIEPSGFVEDWHRIAKVGHRAGLLSSRVMIVVFVDFQCGACKILAERLAQIRHEYEDDIAIVFRHFPLRAHPFSMRAALASECAARQNAFWPFHDALFFKQDSIGMRSWSDFAAEANVSDIGAFERCVQDVDSSASATVSRDIAEGKELDVTATPTFFLNGKRFIGAVPSNFLRQQVRSILDEADRR